MGKIPIVNEQDEVVGYKEREEITKDDVYRVSSLWITNSRGYILLARRGWNKRHDPGKWGPAVAGTVDEGETYEQNIIKEAEEELGIKGIKFNEGPKKRSAVNWNYFVQQYDVVLDWDVSQFIPEEEQVAEVRWFSVEELQAMLREKPDDFLQGIHRIMKEYETKS